MSLNLDELHKTALEFPEAANAEGLTSLRRDCGKTTLQMCHALNKLCFVMTVIVVYGYENDLRYMPKMMMDLAKNYGFHRIRYIQNLRILRMETSPEQQKVVRFVKRGNLREAMRGLDQQELDVQSLVDHE